MYLFIMIMADNDDHIVIIIMIISIKSIILVIPTIKFIFVYKG